VVIAGAAGQAGAACALALANAGAGLLLCDHDGQRLRRLARATGGVARFCDVASETSVDILAAEILAAFPSLHVLINAAGSGYVRSLAMMRMSRGLLPGLRRGPGRKLIINIAPTAHVSSHADLFPYAASDEAFVRLSEAIGLQTRGTPIETVTVVPGAKRRRLAMLARDSHAMAARQVCVDSLESDAIAALVVQIVNAAIPLAPPAGPQELAHRPARH
jgi:NAD(P)-dependent dehydrogenase (short-subunit alcohol dehydrogenase family)